ncbi:hypothetical protein O7608_20015 [Solwaraspora sp. WMMA2056]|uniref:hypothetical protein n=1 Tax=Solwaraspora sp. WMMA2056 TaxID=3015161 RepID=UPI00259BA878|nr:hypothetical protein [Solwaraspora sp. WMMA2056]WJK38778.1 hypothetical protein O7608_20015 [Solwaraspora sp. WMMA2056]
MVDTVPASDQQWELANALFLPSDAEVAYRQHVAGPDAPKWVTEGDALVLSYPPPTASANLRYKDFDAFAVFAVQGTGLGTPYTTGPQQGVWQWQQDEIDVDKWVVAGLKLDDQFESMPKDSPIRRFENLQLSLNSLINYNPAANDVASRRTFWTNETVLVGVGKWAEHWANEFKRYASELKTDASAWEGSAAGQFAALLREFEKRLREVHREVYPGGATSVPRAIGDGVLAMEKALNDLYRGHVAFYSDPESWVPRYHVFNALHDHYKGVQNAVRLEDNKPVFLNESYDPRSQVMRDAVDKAAKASWLAEVEKILDPVGRTVISSIRTQYGTSAEVFANAKFDTAPRLVPPTSSGSGGGNGNSEIEKLQDDYEKTIDKLVDRYDKIIADLEDDLRNQKDEFEEILKQNNDDNREAMNKMEEDYERVIDDLQDDMRAQKESYDEIIKDLNDDQRTNIAGMKEDYERVIDGLQNDLTAQKEDFDSILRGEGGPNQFATVNPGPLLLPTAPQSGSGGNDPARLQYPEGTVLGPDGRPILDADGAPVVLPPGSRIGPDGTVTGPDGQPVRDGDGAPVLVPPGSSIVTDVPRAPAPQVGRLEPPAGGFDSPPPDLQTAWDLARDPNPMWLVPGGDGGLNLVGPDSTQRSIGGLELVPDGKGGYDLVTDGGTRTPVGGFDLVPGDTDGVRLLPNGDGGVDLVSPDGTRRTIEGLVLVPDGKGGYDLVTDGGTRTPVDWLSPGSPVPPPGTIVPPEVVVPSPTPRPDLVGGRDDFGLDIPRPGPGVLVPPAADLVGGDGTPGGGVSGPGSLVGGVGGTPGQVPAGQTPASAGTSDGAGLGPSAGASGTAGSNYPPYLPPPGGGGGGGGGSQDQPRNRTPYPLREEIDQARSRANRRKSDEPRGWPWETTESTPEPPAPATADDILNVLAGNPQRPGTTHRPAKDAAEDLPVGDARESGLAATRVPTMEDTIRGEENTWGADSAASGDTSR